MNQFDILQKAHFHAQAKNWEAAQVEWQQLTLLNPFNGNYWEELATTLYHQKSYCEAIIAYKKALELAAVRRFWDAYKLACCYALLNNLDRSLMWLEQSFELGFNNMKMVQTDDDLKGLHNHPRFRSLVAWVNLDQMSRDEGYRYDLQLLVKQLKRLGYAPFRMITEAEFDSAVKKVHDNIPTLTDTQVIVEFAKLLHLAGDGHTRIISSPHRDDFCRNTPLEYYIYEEGVFIIRAAPQYESLLGSQVLAIDGNSIQSVLEAIYPMVSYDNRQWLKHMTPFFMRNIPMLHALGQAKRLDKVTLTVRDMKDNQHTVNVTPDDTSPIWYHKWYEDEWIVLPSLPRTMRQQHRPYWFEYNSASRQVYVQFNQVKDMESESLADFTKRLFEHVDSSPVERLVLDVRYNNGGNTYLHMPLVHAIIGNKKINREGHLFILIGRRTFSAAMNFVTLLDRHANPIFIGEPTGSCPNFVGEGTETELPYSKLNISTSDLFWQSSWPTDERIWIAPHYFVPLTFADISAGRDATLEVVDKYIHE